MPDPQSWDDYYPSKEKHMPDYFRPKSGETVNMPYFPNMYLDFDWSPIEIPDEKNIPNPSFLPAEYTAPMCPGMCHKSILICFLSRQSDCLKFWRMTWMMWVREPVRSLIAAGTTTSMSWMQDNGKEQSKDI